MQERKTVQIIVDGKPMQVAAGISVAAAVLGHTHHGFYRHAVDGTERAPYCLMGVCFECMLEINGKANVQSCLVNVEEGMVVNTTNSPAKAQAQSKE